VKPVSVQKAPERRRLTLAGGPLRLDLLSNPYGPSIRVQEALASEDDLHLHDYQREATLKRRLGEMVGVPHEWIVLTNGADEAILMALLAQRAHGPVVIFPPTDPVQERLARLAGTEAVMMPRSYRFTVDIDASRTAELPRNGLAIVQSPNDPTGTVVSAADLIRLSRASRAVLLDERHGEYSGRSLVPLVREFENLAVVQSLETWAGLAGLPIAYIIARPQLAHTLEAHRPVARVAAAAMIAAHATLDDLVYVRATARRVRDEKAHMHRMLRKLNLLRPLPSWANFILAKIERGNAESIQQDLAARDIFVYRPIDPALDQHLRIAAATPETTRLLKEALVDIALEIP